MNQNLPLRTRELLMHLEDNDSVILSTLTKDDLKILDVLDEVTINEMPLSDLDDIANSVMMRIIKKDYWEILKDVLKTHPKYCQTYDTDIEQS